MKTVTAITGKSETVASYCLLDYQNAFHYLNDLLMISTTPTNAITQDMRYLDQEERINRIISFISNPSSDLESHVKETLETFAQQLILFIEKNYKNFHSAYEREKLVPLLPNQASVLQKLCVRYRDALTKLHEAANDPYNLLLQDSVCFFKTVIEQSNPNTIPTPTHSFIRLTQAYAPPLIFLGALIGGGVIINNTYDKKTKLEKLYDETYDEASAMITGLKKGKIALHHRYNNACQKLLEERSLLCLPRYKPSCTSCLKELIEKVITYNQRLKLCISISAAQHSFSELINNSNKAQTLSVLYLQYKKEGLGTSFISEMDQLMKTYTSGARDSAIEKLSQLMSNPAKTLVDCSAQELATNAREFEQAWSTIAQGNAPTGDEARFKKAFSSLYRAAVAYTSKLKRACRLLEELQTLQPLDKGKSDKVNALRDKLFPFAQEIKSAHDLDNHTHKETLINDCLALESMTLPQKHYDVWCKLEQSAKVSLKEFKFIINHGSKGEITDIENVFKVECVICQDTPDAGSILVTHKACGKGYYCIECIKKWLEERFTSHESRLGRTCPQCKQAFSPGAYASLNNATSSHDFIVVGTPQEAIKKTFYEMYQRVLHDHNDKHYVTADREQLKERIQNMPVTDLGHVIAGKKPHCTVCSSDISQGDALVKMQHGSCSNILHEGCLTITLEGQVSPHAHCPFCQQIFTFSPSAAANGSFLHKYPAFFKPLTYTQKDLSRLILQDEGLLKKCFMYLQLTAQEK